MAISFYFPFFETLRRRTLFFSCIIFPENSHVGEKKSLIFPFWQGLWVPDGINSEAKNSLMQGALQAIR
jgi:hypothetical protein